MFKNYLKIFIQDLFKHKLFSVIIIFGLAVGLASCLVIAAFVRHELTYDQFFPNADNIYRVSQTVVIPDGTRLVSSRSSAPLAALLEQDFPQVNAVTRIYPYRALLSRDDFSSYEDDFHFVDSNFFDFFVVDWLEGEASVALNTANGVVLTESLAKKYFGGESPLGEILQIDNKQVLEVTGVIEDLPTNTHLSGDAFAVMSLLNVIHQAPDRLFNSWFGGGGGFFTYMRLENNSEISDLESQLPAFGERHINNVQQLKAEFQVTKIADIYLQQDPLFSEFGTSASMKASGSMSVVYVFGAIAVAILLIASINFVNLSVAKSARRDKEVGLRKTFGARKTQLIRQYIGESIVLCMIAMVLAVVLAEIFIPLLEQYLVLNFSYSFLTDPFIVGGIFIGVFVIGISAGSYPAFYLSAFHPLRSLKRNKYDSKRGGMFQNFLVVLQFSISIVLLIVSAGIFTQMRYASEIDLGFSKDQIVVVNVESDAFPNQFQPFKNILLNNPDILNVTSSSSTPEQQTNFTPVRKEGEESNRLIASASIDFDFFSTYDIRLISGRLFDEVLATDQPPLMTNQEFIEAESVRLNTIINENAAREFGWTPEEAVGKSLYIIPNVVSTIVGVVENTVESARRVPNPIMYGVAPLQMAGSQISVKIRGDNVAGVLEYIDSSWDSVSPDEPIVRTFLDDTVQAVYLNETRQMRVFFIFSALSIVIACMGLYGLTTFNTKTRTKEIGVRKVMGGSVWSIVLLLTNDFSKLVLISNIIAWPVAYIAMNRWLENFAYRIDLTPIIFIGSGLIALCIAWVTVGGTAAKAASAKPVLALRYE